MALRKLKLKRKKTDTPQNGEDVRKYVARAVSIVRADEVLPVDEEEVTTYDNLIALRKAKLIDNNGYRQVLKRLDENKGGAAGMTNTEKMAAAAVFAFSNPIENIQQYPDVRDRITNGMYSFHEPNIEARKERFRYASSIIYNTVNYDTAKQVMNRFIIPQTAQNVSLFVSFVEFGLKGSAYGDADYFIMDYIGSTGAFLNAGLQQDIENDMQPVTGNLTVQQTLNAIEAALIDGNFKIP